jgi:beta-galactosidase/beta-glucuronidase
VTRRAIVLTLASTALLLAAFVAVPRAQSAWKPVSGTLVSRFAKDVVPDKVHPEYPRPQLTRADWQNLNGLWQYAIRPKDDGQPDAGRFDGTILVPFAPESGLSGVGKQVGPDQRLWYRRTFQVPAAWKGRRIVLRFEAVDWDARVWLNGKELGRHTGGYDPFAFDITPALKADADQELVLSVWDPSDAGWQPRGKQVRRPRTIWYTPTTGIWQTVWLEPLPEAAIERIKLTPDADAGTLRIDAWLRGVCDGCTIGAVATPDGKPVARAEGAADGPVTLTVPKPRLWSPAQPFLYDLALTLARDATTVDQVGSYFGLRKIAVGQAVRGPEGPRRRDTAKGAAASAAPAVTRLLLNNQPLFQLGFLDQGFWPDGLHTAPTDEALRFDIEATRQIGMNLARKHIKIEPERWYYWADKLGLLVWQDMPSGSNATPEARQNFAREWRDVIDARRNHPSIVMWVVFNEGWGQPDKAGTNMLADWTAQYDPTRLVNHASGWTDYGGGHVNDIHKYPGPAMPPLEEKRASVLGEFGGLGLPVRGHTWQDEKNWGYVSFKDAAELEKAYRERFAELREMVAKGLSAAVYTQTTDVEIEVNGLMTYDRAMFKIPPETLAAIHRTLY